MKKKKKKKKEHNRYSMTNGYRCTCNIDTNVLIDEACVLHKAIFNSEITVDVARKYVKAHDYYILDATETELCWMRRMVKMGLDVEALDIALKMTDKNHILVRKVKMIIYICESFKKYYETFINEQQQREKAFAILLFHGMRTLYKLLKGNCLLRRYRKYEIKNV